METEPREDVTESSEDEADSFDTYGVFQSDYEFKFVQEGNDKTTLMLPPVTYDSMEVKYFNIEIEVDSELNVGALQKEESLNGTTRFFFRIAKQGLQLSPMDDNEASEKLVEDEYEEVKDTAAEKAEKSKKGKAKKPRTAMDAHNYSKPKVVMISAPSVKVEEDYEEIEKAQYEALDGTQLDKDTSFAEEVCDEGEEEEFDEEGEDLDYDDDGDDDDDMDDFEEIEIGGNMTLPGEEEEEDEEDDEMKTPKRKGKKPKVETMSDKKRRKYDRTNHYSKNSSNFTVEFTEEGYRIYKCNFCQHITKQAGNMRGHIRTHTGERPYACEVCGFKFSDLSNLRSHRQTHKEERSYMCDICGSGFKTRNTLSSHYKRHVKLGNFPCVYCSYHARSQSVLLDHMATHTGEKRYQCDVCFTKFSRKASLYRHMHLHTGKKFQCHICAKGFSRKEYFRKHLVDEHHFSGHEDLIAKRIHRVKPVYEVKHATSTDSDSFKADDSQ